MMKELVQLVNDVNANLLRAELIMNLVEPGSQEKEQFRLLGAFDVLWNVHGEQ